MVSWDYIMISFVSPKFCSNEQFNVAPILKPLITLHPFTIQNLALLSQSE